MATNFTRAWNAAYEATPPASQVVSQGAQRVQEYKKDVRERIIVDHTWNDGLSSSSLDGEHSKLTMAVRTAPTNIADRIIGYAKDFDPGSGAKASFHLIDEDGTEIRMTQEGAIALLKLQNSWAKSQATAENALTDAATIVVDAALSNAFKVTLGGNRTLGNPSNGVAGQIITIKITQDATGSRTLGYGSNWRANTGDDLTLSTGIADVDFLVGYCLDGTLWVVLNLKLNVLSVIP